MVVLILGYALCAVSINGNVTFHEQQECVYDFPSLSLATRASADVSELVFKSGEV